MIGNKNEFYSFHDERSKFIKNSVFYFVLKSSDASISKYTCLGIFCKQDVSFEGNVFVIIFLNLIPCTLFDNYAINS